MLSPMALSQTALKDLWEGGQKDRLGPWEQARALAFREASKELHGGEVNVPWVCARVQKNDGTPPHRQSLHDSFALVDGDPDWFPGKHTGSKRGPKPLFNLAKKRRCAKVMMKVKHEDGDEPTLEEMKVRCPASVINPQTGEPFDDKILRKVFAEECYDLDPENPWRFRPRLRKRYLSPQLVEHRSAMCKHLLAAAFAHCTPGWFFQNVLWIDPCSSIRPGSKAQFLLQKQVLKGTKGYQSSDALMESFNLRGPETALKQRTWSGHKVNWVIVLARGVVAVKVLPSDWEPNGAGMATVAGCLEGWLREMLGPDARLPRIIASDRGPGMYAPNGMIVRDYDCAVRAAGFRSFMGPDAKKQAPDMGDLFPHETAVAWVRNRLRRIKPRHLPWEESEAQWAQRMQAAVDHANENYDTDALCRAFPDRLRMCNALSGGRVRT